ncbi:hypothetical protein [Methylicorpusculum sp.]|nr:hypothetical protein [Methylicorpusculum sp.]
MAILAGAYEMEKKCAADFIQNMRIVLDDFFTTMKFPGFASRLIISRSIF